jgi:hypothetical protein
MAHTRACVCACVRVRACVCGCGTQRACACRGTAPTRRCMLRAARARARARARGTLLSRAHLRLDEPDDVLHLGLAQEVVVDERARAPADRLNPAGAGGVRGAARHSSARAWRMPHGPSRLLSCRVRAARHAQRGGCSAGDTRAATARPGTCTHHLRCCCSGRYVSPRQPMNGSSRCAWLGCFGCCCCVMGWWLEPQAAHARAAPHSSSSARHNRVALPCRHDGVLCRCRVRAAVPAMVCLVLCCLVC